MLLIKVGDKTSQQQKTDQWILVIMHAHACAHTQWQTSQCEPLLFCVARQRKPLGPWLLRRMAYDHSLNRHTHTHTLSVRVLVRQHIGRMGWRVSLPIALLLSCVRSSFLAINNSSKKDNYSWFNSLCIYSSAYLLPLWRNEDQFWFWFFLAKGCKEPWRHVYYS